MVCNKVLIDFINSHVVDYSILITVQSESSGNIRILSKYEQSVLQETPNDGWNVHCARRFMACV